MAEPSICHEVTRSGRRIGRGTGFLEKYDSESHVRRTSQQGEELRTLHLAKGTHLDPPDHIHIHIRVTKVPAVCTLLH